MKRKHIIFILIVSIMLFVGTFYNNITYATQQSNEDILSNLDDYKPKNIGNEQVLVEKAGKIITIINVVGIIISVITLMIIGFNYMMGSVEEKANYKKAMMPWLIGAIILFTATTIPNIIYNVSKSLWDDSPYIDTIIDTEKDRIYTMK